MKQHLRKTTCPSDDIPRKLSCERNAREPRGHIPDDYLASNFDFRSSETRVFLPSQKETLHMVRFLHVVRPYCQAAEIQVSFDILHHPGDLASPLRSHLRRYRSVKSDRFVRHVTDDYSYDRLPYQIYRATWWSFAFIGLQLVRLRGWKTTLTLIWQQMLSNTESPKKWNNYSVFTG